MADGNLNLIWLVILLPLIGFGILATLGPRLQKSLGKGAVGIVAVVPIVLSFVIGCVVTQALAGLDPANRHTVTTGPDWINILGLRVPFEWVVDPLSMTMVLIITGIGALIHIYSTGYMAEEREYSRFFAYLNLFIAAMLVLVLGNNLPLMFIGWEGVGLCSYLLIGFWYQDKANAKAANKAFIVNRIGDWCFMLAMFLIVAVLANAANVGGRFLSFDVMIPAIQSELADKPALSTAIALLLFGAAAGKSAQFPLYVWLPDAMAGPTPVSALIHAATMVTSGVVLLNRLNIVFQMSPVASAVVCAIGAFTALFAALIAFGQTDIKKVLAYSTVSQLGFMFIGCGAGAYWSGMFHVTTHAFFKALLFLGAGAVIHAMAHDQDMRNYGNLRKYMPITFITMVIGWLAIAGFPFMSGFMSKEVILGAALANDHAAIQAVQVGQWAGWVGLFVAALTALYMTRLMGLTFFGKEERWRSLPAESHGHDDEHHGLTPDHKPHEAPLTMTVPLIILAILSFAGGYVLYQDHRFEHWLYPSGVALLGEVSYKYPNLMALSIGAGAVGLVLGVLFYFRGLPKDQGLDESKWSPLRRLQRDQFGFDRLTDTVFVEGGAELATGVYRGVEKGAVDGVVEGSGVMASGMGELLRRIQTGTVRVYAAIMLIGAVGLMAFIFMLMSRGGIR